MIGWYDEHNVVQKLFKILFIFILNWKKLTKKKNDFFIYNIYISAKFIKKKENIKKLMFFAVILWNYFHKRLKIFLNTIKYSYKFEFFFS